MAARNNVKYPWARWFAKRQFSLVRGKDFHCDPRIMSAQIHNAAQRYAPGRRIEVDYYYCTKYWEDAIRVTVKPRGPGALRTYGGPPRARRQAA